MRKKQTGDLIADNEDPNHGKGTVVDVTVCILGVLLVVAVCLLLWWQKGGTWFEQPLLNVIGYVGVAVSIVGVLLAYLIFRRQAREGASANHYQKRVLAELQLLLVGVDQKVSDLAVQQASDSVPDAEAEQGAAAEDLWEAFTPETEDSAVYLSSPSGRRRRVYVPRAIPLAVIGALVKTWDGQGLTGRWTVGALRGAFRAEGKGNHPWYLVLAPPGDDSTPRVWKVTRGPGGTDHAMQIRDGREFQ
ncbi:hypothetical protein ABLI39_08010 [Pseudarthrobacter sp. B907]|uniref:hypothetical protein n=1 Tax=Pseudarthrobacter sp. B907 TaxID=3158261 RepID=UPI0032DB08F5